MQPHPSAAPELPEQPAAMRLAMLETKVANLEVALRTSRLIGMAIGVVMERCKLGETEAFELLVQVSQQQHRKVREVAQELVFTGAIPVHV